MALNRRSEVQWQPGGLDVHCHLPPGVEQRYVCPFLISHVVSLTWCWPWVHHIYKGVKVEMAEMSTIVVILHCHFRKERVLIEEICMKLMCKYERSDVSPVCWLQVFLIQGNVWSCQMAVSLGFLGPWGIDGLAGCFQTILKVLVLKAPSISNIFRDFHEAGYTWTRSIVPLWHQRGLHDLSHPKSFRLSNHSCHLQCLVELQAYDGMLEVAHAQQWGKTLQQTEDWSFYPLGSMKKTFTAEMQGNLLDVVKFMDPPDFSSFLFCPQGYPMHAVFSF